MGADFSVQPALTSKTNPVLPRRAPTVDRMSTTPAPAREQRRVSAPTRTTPEGGARASPFPWTTQQRAPGGGPPPISLSSMGAAAATPVPLLRRRHEFRDLQRDC